MATATEETPGMGTAMPDHAGHTATDGLTFLLCAAARRETLKSEIQLLSFQRSAYIVSTKCRLTLENFAQRHAEDFIGVSDSRK